MKNVIVNFCMILWFESTVKIKQVHMVNVTDMLIWLVSDEN